MRSHQIYVVILGITQSGDAVEFEVDDCVKRVDPGHRADTVGVLMSHQKHLRCLLLSFARPHQKHLRCSLPSKKEKEVGIEREAPGHEVEQVIWVAVGQRTVTTANRFPNGALPCRARRYDIRLVNSRKSPIKHGRQIRRLFRSSQKGYMASTPIRGLRQFEPAPVVWTGRHQDLPEP